MAKRNNDTFLDKFLAIFGIRRPKKKIKAVSKRKEVKRPSKDVYTEKKAKNCFAVGGKM